MAHICWSAVLELDPLESHVTYAYWCNGYPSFCSSVDNTGWSAYGTIDALSVNAIYPQAPAIAFQQPACGTDVTALAPDYAPGWHAFLPFNHPAVDEWYDDQPVYPHMVIDYNDKVHILSTRPVDNGVYYDATDDFATWDAPGWIELPVSSMAVSAVPVSSEYDGRVALLAHDYLNIDAPPMPMDFFTNDVWAFLSEDGDFTEWDEVVVVNVTDLFDAEATWHPLPGHVYAHSDLDGVFDVTGNLHVVYTTQPYWLEYTTLDGDTLDTPWRSAHTGQIWHAVVDPDGEVLDYSHVAGYVGENNDDNPDFAGFYEGDPGDMGSLTDRPSLAINTETGTLYCMWRSFVDLADTSAAGFSNADLWVRSSCDNGLSWGPAVNITDSQTPGCTSGNCRSEAWGSLAEETRNGLLSIEFLEDMDAGAAPCGEGGWTDNPVIYMQVPEAVVPCGEPWDAAAHPTRLTDTFWNWDVLADGSYEIVDEMHLLNEGREELDLHSIEVLYNEYLPLISIEQVNGNLGDVIEPYQVGIYRCSWDAVIADDRHDAIVRFNTNGGSVDFRLSNRNPIDWETVDVWLYMVAGVDEQPEVPERISLSQNYPNPFNPSTTIEFELAVPQSVRLEVFNLLGERVALLADGVHAPGTHRVMFDGSGLSSGIYVYRLSSGTEELSRRMVLTK